MSSQSQSASQHPAPKEAHTAHCCCNSCEMKRRGVADAHKAFDAHSRALGKATRASRKRPHCLRCGAGAEWIENS